jgi:RNA polymerase sigma factor (sigma-70 family)
MSDPADVAALRRLLVGQYDEFKRQLTRRLGSEDLAGDVLQETYLHLERPAPVRAVSSPRQYLLTVATNIARMGFRRDRRWSNLTELDAVLGFVDDTPDPLRSFEARQELKVLQDAFEELTPRRQRILFASRVEGVKLRDLAEELGLSQRAVEKELKAALMLCGLRLKRDIVQRFGPRPQEASMEDVDATDAGESRDD